MSEFMRTLCKYYMKYLDTDFREQGMPSRQYKHNEHNGDTYTWDIEDYNKRREVIQSLKKGLKDFPDRFGVELKQLKYTREAANDLEFYLNVGEIQYKEVRYPIFYVRLSVERNDVNEFIVEPDQQFYFQTKLIEGLENETKKFDFDVPNRMYHLGQFEDDNFKIHFDKIMNSICSFFDLNAISIFDNDIKQVQNDTVLIRNSIVISLCEKSDDSVINDYESLIQALSEEGSAEFNVFEGLTEEFIFKNPVSFNSKIEKEYENRTMPERFSYQSPIPLNKEQQQILMAVRTKDGCDRIVIEGPPGTGKSHTIAAIIYDALLRGKTVLVTSDKEEALNVVIEKMDQILKSVANEVEVENPILRLDGRNANLSQVFETSNSEKISKRAKLFNQKMELIKTEANMYKESIEKKLSKERDIWTKLKKSPFSDMKEFDSTFEEKFSEYIEIEELIDKAEIILDYYDLVNELKKLSHYSSLNKQEVELLLQKMPKSFLLAGEIYKDNVSHLTKFLDEVTKLGVLGLFFKPQKRKLIEKEFNDKFIISGVSTPIRKRKMLSEEHKFYKALQNISEEDLFKILRDGVENFKNYLKKSQEFHEINERYKDLVTRIPVTSSKLEKAKKNPFLETTKEELNNLILYLKNIEQYGKYLLEISGLHIESDRKCMENRLVMELVNLLDNRLINFLESYRNDVSELKKVIKQKKQLKKGHVDMLLKATPILVVGIRNLGDFLPLEKNLFDLLIIDEASQVSVAQAFPAIIRAKKTIVLGDTKQFDNIKSKKAALNVNKREFDLVRRAYEQELRELNLTQHDMELKKGKVSNFDIHTNILRFMQSISNYNAILTKHFRGYIELISYSNEYFYNKALQVMKIRGVPKSEVIQFFEVKPQAPQKGKEKINHEEAEFILKELRMLKKLRYKGTVGILSPTTDQVKHIKSLIDSDIDSSYFRNKFNLNVFTFDTCQGEERDIVFYSLVEREGQRILNNIFMVDESRFNEGEDAPEHLKRLNVGLSRAKESIRFVISKPIEKFSGNIRNALKHFQRQLNQPESIQLFQKTDKKSKMENPVLQCILQTDLYINNENNIEIIPQFPIGEYIRQLDPYAPDRKYKTDFLVMLNDKKVIIEYDGFKEHFKDRDEINLENYFDHYNDQDIERQRTIESYGYPFIRLNKFHMRNNPVQHLNDAFSKYFEGGECL